MRKSSIFALLLFCVGWVLVVTQPQAQLGMTGVGPGGFGAGGATEGTVLIDTATISGQSNASVTTWNFNNGTQFTLNLGSGPNGTTNRALGIALFFCQTGGISSGPTVSWDAVDMGSPVGSIVDAVRGDIYFFGLVAPNTGAKNIVASWTTANQVVLALLSVVGASQVGGTTTFANLTSNTGITSVSSVSVTAPSTRISMGAFTSPNNNYTSPVSGTTDIGHTDSCNTDAVAAGYATGSANPTLSYNPSQTTWAALGVSIKGN